MYLSSMQRNVISPFQVRAQITARLKLKFALECIHTCTYTQT